LEVVLLYGGECPEGSFHVTSGCACPPATVAPEWLLALALEEDGLVREPRRLSLLLREAPGPHTIAKAAAVEPERWEGLLHVSLYTDGSCSEQCACLLPFAPATSSLSVLGQREACIFAHGLSTSFLKALLHAAAASGAERLYLVDPPPDFPLYTKITVTGLEGYRAVARMPAPRGLRLPAVASIRAHLEKGEVLQERELRARLPPLGRRPSLLKLAFGEEKQVAQALLEELEASGSLMSSRAFLEVAASLSERGRSVARLLVLFGYVQLRQAQVELAGKGIYALLAEL